MNTNTIMDLDFSVNIGKKSVKVYPPVELEWISIKTDEWYNEILEFIGEDILDFNEIKVHPTLFKEMQEYRKNNKKHMRPPNHSFIRAGRLWKKIYKDPLGRI